MQRANWWFVEYRGETRKERRRREHEARERAEVAAFKAARQKARQLATPRTPPAAPVSGTPYNLLVVACVALGGVAYVLLGSCAKKKGRPNRQVETPKNPGNDLLSHTVTRAVPSAREGLTSVFGMDNGCFPSAIVAGN